MKQLFLLRGCQGAGKSTFIKEQNLEEYTLSPDVLRMQYSSPVYDTKGRQVISQEKEAKVWKVLYEMLEDRMAHGEFIVIDATHSTAKLINNYKKLKQKYGYRTYVVEFDTPLEECLHRNRQRGSLKFVPEEVIENVHERLQHENVPSWCQKITPKEFNKYAKWKLQDFSDYKKIHVIGDVHGCFTALNEFVTYEQIADNQDEAFIFVGDLFDRGLENKQVFELIESIYQLPNVHIIEGNHERHLRTYAEKHNDISIKEGDNEFKAYMNVYKARGFIQSTLKEFMDFGITPERVKPVTKKFLQCLYFRYHKTNYIITHGGIVPQMLGNLAKVSTHQLINGVGGYEFEVDDMWKGFRYTVQIHGHRNLFRNPLQADGSINLEGRVEKGGHLRAVVITPPDKEFNNYELHEIKNEVFNPQFLLSERHTDKLDEDITVEQFIEVAKMDSRNIKVKPQYDNVKSINFTNRMFRSSKWNQLAVHARGLFVRENGVDSEVVGRAYNKFFNLNEKKETKIENLIETIQFPLKSYHKANGYLGILFYDKERDELVYSSKSTTHLGQDGNNKFAQRFKEIADETIRDGGQDFIKEYCKTFNVSMVFEVIDPIDDPHIVAYKEKQIVLLDIILNQLSFDKKSDDIVADVATKIGVPHVKDSVVYYDNWQEFYQWYKEAKDDLSIRHEGFVFEDSKGFMFKFKSKWYNDWKYMRSVVGNMKSGKPPKQYYLQNNPELREFYYWMKQQDAKWQQLDIITLRNKFQHEKLLKEFE